MAFIEVFVICAFFVSFFFRGGAVLNLPQNLKKKTQNELLRHFEYMNPNLNKTELINLLPSTSVHVFPLFFFCFANLFVFLSFFFFYEISQFVCFVTHHDDTG